MGRRMWLGGGRDCSRGAWGAEDVGMGHGRGDSGWDGWMDGWRFSYFAAWEIVGCGEGVGFLAWKVGLFEGWRGYGRGVGTGGLRMFWLRHWIV